MNYTVAGSITKRPISVSDIFVNGRPAAASPDGKTFRIVAECGVESVSIDVSADPDATVEISPANFVLTDYGDNRFDITVTAQNGATQTCALFVERPYDLIVYEYADVPTISLNTQNNGGHVFTAFQWFRNDGTAIAGANKPYLPVTDNAPYYAEMTLIDGRIFRTCEVRRSHSPSAGLTAYPNPTQGQVTVKYEGAQNIIQVFDLYGKLVLHTYDNPIDLSGLSAGVYVIKVGNETVRVIVNR
jgi:hypothetical protein